MTFISQIFQRAAAYSIARLPGFVTKGQHRLAQWYQGNSYFKFPVGACLDYNMSVVGLGDFGPTPYGWRVVAHTTTYDGKDAYYLTDENEDLRFFSKWAIESHFERRRDTHIDPVKGMEISMK